MGKLGRKEEIEKELVSDSLEGLKLFYFIREMIQIWEISGDVGPNKDHESSLVFDGFRFGLGWLCFTFNNSILDFLAVKLRALLLTFGGWIELICLLSRWRV